MPTSQSKFTHSTLTTMQTFSAPALIPDNVGYGRPVLSAWIKRQFKRGAILILEIFRQILGNISQTQTPIIDYVQLIYVNNLHFNPIEIKLSL